jgi:hypothetical protein
MEVRRKRAWGRWTEPGAGLLGGQYEPFRGDSAAAVGAWMFH